MVPDDLPRILIVEDREEDVSGLKLDLESAGKAMVDVRGPDDVEARDLIGADLVLVDFDLEEWISQGAGFTISKQPPDGLALATVFRRYLAVHRQDSPTAVAVLTAKTKRLSSPFPPENRLHLLARANNLEWVFVKQDKQVADRVASLATCVRSLPKSWPDGIKSVEEIVRLLGVDPQDPRLPRYGEIIQSCHPPVHELSRWSHGLAVVRWLLHRILPYPCFLMCSQDQQRHDPCSCATIL